MYFLREAFWASLVGWFWFVLFLVGYGCRVGFVCRLSMYSWSCCWVVVFISLIW